MLLMCCTQYVSKFGNFRSGHRTGKISFHFSPKQRQCQRMFKLPYTVTVISYASKVMLKILQARLQQYMNWELLDVQAGVGKGKRSRDQIVNICWIREKAREFQKSISFCFIDYVKAFDCVDHNKLWKILQEMGIPDYLPISWETSMQVKKQQLQPDNGLVPNWERSLSRLYIAMLLI